VCIYQRRQPGFHSIRELLVFFIFTINPASSLLSILSPCFANQNLAYPAQIYFIKKPEYRLRTDLTVNPQISNLPFLSCGCTFLLHA
jgi:hypothetical protein